MNYSYNCLFHQKYWLLILLFFTSTTLSWAQFGYTQTSNNNCTTITSAADIDVSLSGTTYTWTPNVTVNQDLTDVTNGYYSLSIDGGATNLPVIVGVPVQWTNLFGATDATDGRVQANTSTEWTAASGATSQATLGSGVEGGFTYVIDNLSTSTNSMVGLSTPNTNPAYTSIKNSFYITPNNTLIVYWNHGANSLNTEITVALNDRLTMVRTSTSIYYYHNADLVYTDTEAANGTNELVVDISIINGTSPKIWFSTCPASSVGTVTYVQNSADDCIAPTNAGSATLTPQGGGSYTYSGGATTANPTGLANGLYQVAVNDGFSSTNVPMIIGTPVMWDNLQLTSHSNGKVFAREGGTDANAGAISASGLASGTDGGITFIHDNNLGYYMMGLSQSNGSPSWTSLEYSVYLDQNSIYVYQSGSLINTYYGLSNGDRMTIVREGSTIAYYQNSNLLYRTATIAGLNTQVLYADATVWRDETPVIYSSFCTNTAGNLALKYTQTVADDCGTGPGEGVVGLQGSGGTAAYTYTWNGGSTANPRSALTLGLYEVTLTGGASVASPVVVGDHVVWGNLSNASQTGGTLTADATTVWATPSGGLSTNRLASGTDGGITYVVGTTNENYQVGLSTSTSTSPAWESQNYSVWIGDYNRITIYESGTEIGKFTSVTAGDRISIIRVGGNIEYYHNDIQVRSVATATGDLYADISVIDGTSPAIYASFCTSAPSALPINVSYIQNTPDNCATVGVGNGEGVITVTTTGGTGVYSYSWAGDNGASVSDTRTALSRGFDEVTVTSGATVETIPVISGTLVNWGNLVSVTQSNGTVTSTSPRADRVYAALTDDGAFSTNELPAGVDGGITYVIPTLVDIDQYMFGLSTNIDPTNARWESLGYSVYIFGNSIYTYVGPANSNSTNTTVSVGDRITILRRGSFIEFYHNNTIINSVATNPAQALYADVTVVQGTTPALYASFCDTGFRVGGGTGGKKVVATNSNETVSQTLFAYPNPSNGKVTIRLSDKEVKGTVSLRVIDVLGRVILTQNVEKQSSTLETSFDLKNQKTGIYFVEIASENQTQRIKIVKE